MCFLVTCWERADLLALVCGVFCEFVTFPLVSWVRCGTWLYRFLIFAPLLTFIIAFAEATLFSASWASSSDYFFFVLVNDLYIGNPLEAKKDRKYAYSSVRLCSWAHWITVELTPSPAVCIRSFNRIPQSKSMHIMPRGRGGGHIETDQSTSRYFVTFSLEYPKGQCLIGILAQW